MTSKYSFLYQAADGSLMRPEKFLNINKGRTLSSSQLRALRITKVKNESFKRASYKRASDKLQATSYHMCRQKNRTINLNDENKQMLLKSSGSGLSKPSKMPGWAYGTACKRMQNRF
jgi:hypothetical protein